MRRAAAASCDAVCGLSLVCVERLARLASRHISSSWVTGRLSPAHGGVAHGGVAHGGVAHGGVAHGTPASEHVM